MRVGESGQSILELLFSIVSIALTVTAAGWLMKAQWDRGKCANIVFERTHESETQTPPSPVQWGGRVPVEIRSLPSVTIGSAHCGQASETVSLPQLDPKAGL